MSKRSWWRLLMGVVAAMAGAVLILGMFNSGWTPGIGVLGLVVFMAGVSLVARQGFLADRHEQNYQRSKAAHQAPPPPFHPY